MTARSKLCIHSDQDGQLLSLDQLRKLPAPARTRTYVPIQHAEFVDTVIHCVSRAGARVTDMAHGVTRAGDRYFGVLELKGGAADGPSSCEWSMVCGMRNSYDRRIAAGLVVGSRVFVCDNLAFTGEVGFSRKHTGYADVELPVLVAQSVVEWFRGASVQRDKFARWQVRDARGQRDTLLVNALLTDAVTVDQLRLVRSEMETPRYDRFRDGSAWSYFNCFTTVMRDQVRQGALDGAGLSTRTTRLTRVFDELFRPVGV